MPCTAAEPMRPNCTIVAKETNKSDTLILPASTPMSTDPKPYLPEIITENFDEDISNYFGLIKCMILLPRGLFHPVLPHHGQNKLMFALCKTWADTGNPTPCTHSDAERAIQGTWCSVELMKGLEKGYRIVQMHKVWHFLQKSDTLFKEYIDTFAKIKLEASRYPKNCVTDKQKQWNVKDIFENQGIQLDPAKINYNPGLRALAWSRKRLFSEWSTVQAFSGDYEKNPYNFKTYTTSFIGDLTAFFLYGSNYPIYRGLPQYVLQRQKTIL